MLRLRNSAPFVPMLALTACLSAATEPRPEAAPAFDGARALDHVRHLVAIGPRAAGSPGGQKARQYITAHLHAAGWSVDEQAFEANTPLGPIRMVNIRATIGPGAARRERLLIAGHYDTKLFRDFTFVGANDGGSSTAFLLELARVLASATPARSTSPLPIELLFLDGEEAFVEWEGDDHTYGSRHYVAAARSSGDLKNVRALILVDMIGDRDLRIPRESQSTAWLSDVIWSAAKRRRRPEFVDESMPVDDDHVEFLKAGVPAVAIIDLDYPAWHTADDTLDKLSASSLHAVGEVLLAALPDIQRRLTGAR